MITNLVLSFVFTSGTPDGEIRGSHADALSVLPMQNVRFRPKADTKHLKGERDENDSPVSAHDGGSAGRYNDSQCAAVHRPTGRGPRARGETAGGAVSARIHEGSHYG